MAQRKRITDEERKMAFDGIVPPGRTEEWRKYFVRRQKWNAKHKAKTAKKFKVKEEPAAEEETSVEVHGVSETSVIIK